MVKRDSSTWLHVWTGEEWLQVGDVIHATYDGTVSWEVHHPDGSVTLHSAFDYPHPRRVQVDALGNGQAVDDILAMLKGDRSKRE